MTEYAAPAGWREMRPADRAGWIIEHYPIEVFWRWVGFNLRAAAQERRSRQRSGANAPPVRFNLRAAAQERR